MYGAPLVHYCENCMGKWFSKIWKDPVWSKVIAVIITPYVIALLAAIKGFFNDKGYWADLKEILNIGIPLWCAPLFIAFTILCVLMYVQYRRNHDAENSVIRHQGPYITFKDQPQDQCYCAVCWDTEKQKVQLPHYYDDTFKCTKCGNEGAYDYEKEAPTYPPIMRF